MANLMQLQDDASLVDMLEEIDAASPTVATGGTSLLKMNRSTGAWTFGAEDVPVEKGSMWAVVPTTMAAGFISWKGGKVEAEFMSSVGEKPVNPRDLPPVTGRNGWEAQVGFALVCVKGAQTGTVVLYKTSNKGGTEAVAKVRAGVLARAKGGEADIVPVVSFNSTSYQHPEYGKVNKPSFEVTAHISLKQLSEDYSDVLSGVSASARRLPEGDRDMKIIDATPVDIADDEVVVRRRRPLATA